MADSKKQVAEFMNSLKGKDTLKPIYNPEAFVLRSKAKAAAERGDIKPTGCTHPMQYMQQYQDDDPVRKREGKMVNLFECGVCHMLMWLVDPWGDPVTDD